MNQYELFTMFEYECEILKDYRNVIQNTFENGLTESEALILINQAKEHFEEHINKLLDIKFQIEEFIWNNIKEIK